MILKYGNKDITQFVLEYKRKGSIDDETVFLLGNTPSYQIDLKLDNESGIIQTISGKICVYGNDGNLKGSYWVYEAPEKYTATVKLTCFDSMLMSNIPYDTKLSYPTTIKDQLDEIIHLTGLSIEYSNLPSNILTQEVSWWDNTISCRNYIGWIAEISGMNAFADTDGKIVFKGLSMTSDWQSDDVEDYEIDEPFTVSRVCFDNGLLKLESGNDVSNTLYLSANNPYIDTLHNPTAEILKKYQGLSVVSATKVRLGGLDDLKLFDIVEYQKMKFMCLDVTSTYKGGQYEIQDIKGTLTGKNADKVLNRYDDSIRIKKLEVIMNQNEQNLKIVAKEIEGQNEKLSKFEEDLNGFSMTVSETTEKVETIENTKRYRIELNSSNGTAFRNNDIDTVLSVKIYSWDDDISAVVSDSAVTWSRVSSDVNGDKAWNRTGKSINITFDDLSDCATFIVKWNTFESRISLVNVYDGESGTPGKDGKNGTDGKTTYFHMKYAPVSNPTDVQMSETPDKYIGTYVDYISTDSTLAGAYTWSKFMGDDGTDGIPGKNGTNGQTSYIHIRYSNDGGKTFTASNGKTPGDYLGQYTDFTQADSIEVTKYVWIRVKGEKGEQGIPGTKGADGKQLYTWLKYADTPTSGMSDLPTNKAYIGLAYNKESATESSNYADYTWSLVKGEKGDQGVAGAKGADGKQLYTWVKYATDDKGTGISDDPTGKLYIGLAYNKATQAESTVASDYTWALIKGEKGEKGDTGPRGLQGVQGPKGDQGIKGNPGSDGRSSYFHIKYSPVSNPTAAQMTEIPSTYIGTYVDYVETDSIDPTKYTWARFQGLQGETGNQGIPGTNGTNGKTSYLHIKYSNDGGKTFTSNSGEDTGSYIGTCVDYNTVDPTIVTAYKWALIKGEKGDTGSSGKGIKSVTNYYLATASGSGVTSSTSGWTTTVQSVSATKKYLWNYEMLTYTDNSTSSTAPCIIGAYGDKGATGNTGATGSTGPTGVGISSIVEHYAVSTSSTTAPTTWSDTVQTMTVTNKYLWNYETITYTNGTKKDTQKRVIGVYGDKGQTGATGTAGVSITKVEVYYYLSTSNTTQAGGSWVTTVPAWAEGKYMWSKTKTTLSNGTATETSPVCITGAKGNTGATGATGVGVKTTAVTYQASTSGTTVPTGTWATTIPSVAANQYLWTRTVITYTNNTSSTAYSIGKIGAQGVQGPQGATGSAGKGIKSTAITYQASTSGTTTPTGTWATTIPTVAANQYLWTRTIFTYTDNTTTVSYSIGKIGANGATGPQGATGATGKGVASITAEYYLSTSKTTQTGGSWVTTAPVWSTGKYMWTRSKIVYSNPTSTAYTTPLCDSSWEAVNDLEDKVNDQIADTVVEITENYNSSIEQTKENIVQMVENNYTLKTETETMISNTNTRFDQTAKDFEMQFNTTQELISTLDGKVDINKQEIQKFIRFVDGQIELGQSNSKFTLTITNERISFKDNGAEVAYISNSTLYITDANITNSLKIGKYAFVPRANGNLSMKWIG